MSSAPDRGAGAVRPFLISRQESGAYRLTVRETRYNSQAYPIVSATTIDETFGSMASARAYAKMHFGAAAGEFATK